MRHVHIAQQYHLRLHILLSRGQILAQRLPVAERARFQNGLGVFRDPGTRSQHLCMTQYRASNILEVIHLFRLRREESVADENPQTERHP